MCVSAATGEKNIKIRNQVVSSLVWLWWVIDLARFEFKSGIVLFYFFISVSFGESRLLVSWCAGGRCGMTCSDKDHDRSRRPGAEDRGWSHRSGTRWPGGQEVRWRHVRSAPGMWRLGAWVSWLSLKTKVDGLWVVWPQNHSDGFLQFGLKTGGDGFSWSDLKTGGEFLGWASKSRWWRVSRFGPQNLQLWFGDLTLKITVTVSWFGHQNQAGFSLLVAPQNWWREVGAGHAPRSSSLLGMEASLARVF
jgi:hypothetical protein